VRDLGQTFLPDPPHGWSDTHAAWNEGRFDQWVPNKGVTTMTHHTRKDLPYQFALADAFTICDNYHCSLMGPTDPNRYHMWTGWVGNDGRAGGPVITNAEARYDWSTCPERLERAGISWKVYQDIGLGLNAAGSWGFTADPHRQLRRQLAAVLPPVPERPAGDFGAWYVSQVVDILASNPEVWSRMALFVTYDEEGGFFDHLVPPTPPRTPAQGLSTVATTNEIFPGAAGFPTGPLRPRDPRAHDHRLAVDQGGWVDSQLFDHTSMIRFLEARFAHGNPDLIESNITPWRRAVVGDLTSAFNFSKPNTSWNVRLPDTDDFKPRELVRHPDEVPVPPADPAVPDQERGVRPARAIPYRLHADARAGAASVAIEFASSGDATGVFQVRSADATEDPRSYTVEPGRQLADTWDVASGYDVEVFGPNGFFRRFKDGVGGPAAGLAIRALDGGHHDEIVLELENHGLSKIEVTVSNRSSPKRTTLTLAPGAADAPSWSLRRTRGWYDLTVTLKDDPEFEYRYAGHLENGDASISDPGMGRLI
jgi:phospholipase C